MITRAKKSKEELYQTFEIVLNEVRHSRKVINEINKELAANKVRTGTFTEVLANVEKFREVAPEVLCLLTMSLYEHTKNENINPELFFNPPEINAAKHYLGEKSESVEFPIIINNVIRGGTNSDFLTFMRIQDIVLWYKNILSYNYETQRAPKMTKAKNGQFNLSQDVKKKSVKEIASLVEKGKYMPDCITFNFLLDGSDDIVYDEKEHQLIINSCSEVDILDGNHRINGFVEAIEKDPNVELYEGVMIKNYTLENAKSYFGQVSKTNPVPKQRITEMLNERYSDMVVTDLKVKSELSGKIASRQSVANKSGELTNFTILSDAIDDIFKPTSKKDYLDITRYLTDFFDYLIGSFEDEFVKKVAETKELSWINHQNIFVGYVVLAKKMMDKGIDTSKIADIVKGIDFSRETSPLNSIMAAQGKDNSKKVRKAIAEWFNKIEF